MADAEDSNGNTPDEKGGEAGALPPDAVASTGTELSGGRGDRWRAPFRFVAGALQRVSLRMLVFRLVVYGIAAVALFWVCVFTAVRLLVKPEDIKTFVKAQVEEQTGGRLDIGSVSFDVLTGIRIADVQFYPPITEAEPKGYLYGGEVQLTPLANLERLDVGYSIPKMLAGRLHLSAAQMVAPEFHLRQTDGVFNFDSILAYRACRFPRIPQAPCSRQELADAPKEDKDAGGELLPFNPALIYMPIEILAQNIGIKNLRMDMIKEEGGKIAQTLVTNGLTLDMGAHMFKRKSSFWFGMTSPFDNPIELDIKDGARGDDGALTGELTQSVLLRTALNMRCALEDLKLVNVDFATRILEVKTALAGYEDLGAFFKVRMVVNDDYKGLHVETVEAEIADALAYELKGDITLPKGNLEAFALKLKQKFGLDLKSAAALAKPFVPELKASGTISFDDFKIDGLIEPAKFANLDKGIPLPYVAGVVWLEDVYADYPGLGLSMDPVNGDVSIAAGPALTGEGSQVDLSVNMDIPRIAITQNLPVGEITAGVEKMTTKVTARALWPEMVAPVLKINVEAQHVTARGKNIADFDAPLYVDVDADGRADLERVALTANVELTDLLEFTAMADCQARCARFRSNVASRMESLERLHSIALPLGAAMGFADFMPTKLGGNVDVQFTARGRLADPLVTPLPELLKTADVRFNSQVALAKVNAKVPFFKVDLKGFDNRVLASGSLQEQRVELSQKFDSLTLEMPAKADPVTGAPPPDAKPLAVAVNRFTFDVAVVNTVEGPLDLANPLAQLVTGVETWLYVGKVDVEGVLPRPISEIQVDTVLKQAHLTEIEVKSVDVRLPDYGTHVKVAAEALLGGAAALMAGDVLPKSFGVDTRLSVAHAGDERLPGSVKTSGKIDVSVAVRSPDMRSVTVGGDASFDRFNVTIPKPEGQEGNLLVVEDVQGKIPFKQTIVLPPLADLLKPKDEPAAAAIVATATEGVAVPIAGADVPNLADAETKDAAATALEAMDKAMDTYFDKTQDKLLANTNVVALVDYGTIRPFYPERKLLSIKRVEAANLELNRMEFDMELRQNWFAVNQFVIGFLGGKIQGDFQLAFDLGEKNLEALLVTKTKAPGALIVEDILKSLRTSVHMTRLDTRKLIDRFPNLKGKGSSGLSVFSNPYLDGTVHLQLDPRTSELGGGFEMTSIGKEQLRMMLYYVDPFEQDPNIAMIRKALAFGDVRQVSVPFKNGEIGIDVDMRLLGVPLPTPKLSRIPLSQIIQNFKDQSLKDQSAPADGSPGTPPAGDPATPALDVAPTAAAEPAQVSG